MKTINKQNRISGKASLALLAAVSLAAGGAGVWSELQAAGATVTKEVGKELGASGDIGAAGITENGDGTAMVYGMMFFEDGTYWVGSETVTEYTLSSVLKGKKPRKTKGSGTGTGTVNGMLSDVTGLEFTPMVVDLEITVDGTPDVYAMSHQEVTFDYDPDTCSTTVTRISSSGTQAYGSNAGSYTITGVDGLPLMSESNVNGMVGTFTERTRVRIR